MKRSQSLKKQRYKTIAMFHKAEHISFTYLFFGTQERVRHKWVRLRSFQAQIHGFVVSVIKRPRKVCTLGEVNLETRIQTLK